MDLKRVCAEAAIEYIEDSMIIGLGGGSTIEYVIDYICREELNVEVVTPSQKTRKRCLERGLSVLSTEDINEIDIAFDGCDQVDHQLHALKSGGGIHTQEKIIAQMAREYILLVDESKLVPTLTYDHPVVLEILPEALASVSKHIKRITEKIVIRESVEKTGYTISDNGNYLVDIYPTNIKDNQALETQLKLLPGIVDVSLFTNVVTKVLIAEVTGTTRIMSKK